jgi:hypothetical protein
MRIYEGSPRQDFEEVFRSMGAFIDQRGMKDVLLVEAPDGYIVQGLVVSGEHGGTWSESVGTQTKETLTFLDDDIARFMEEASARRGRIPPPPPHVAGQYETAFRVIGRYMDEQKPRLLLRAGRRIRGSHAHEWPGWQSPRTGRIHPRGRQRAGRPWARPSPRRDTNATLIAGHRTAPGGNP